MQKTCYSLLRQGLTDALEVADRLQEKLFTLMTKDIQQEYLFHGA